jgi:hypothetical protein
MADYSIEVSIPNVGPQGSQGEVGPAGPANELTLGEITTGDAGTEAEATISGTPPNQVLDLVLPRGDTGAQGNPGPTGAGGVGVVPAPIYATMQEAVEDGITFGGVFRHTSGSVFWVEEPDPDAATFIAASGATDVWNIQKFVQGVKTLGLWDDMVCWPLRSAQNAGTGTTAYSLGGLGAFNGTLVNGPTWSADGIDFDGSNDHITFNNPLKSATLAAYSLFAVFDSDQTINRGVIGGGGSTANSTAGAILLAGASPFQGPTASSIYHDLTSDGVSQLGSANGSGRRFIDGNTGAMQTAFAGFSGTQIALAANGTREVDNIASATAWNDNTQWGIGARIIPSFSNSFFFLGKISFGAAFDSYLSEAAAADFRTLYKNTIGIGLSLP